MLKLLGHNNSVFRVAFNSKSTSLLSGSDDYSIKLWKVDKSKQNRWNRKHLLVGHTD
jgi:WD40 repeat protein